MRLNLPKIIQVFKETENASETARRLGIHRTTVYRWVKRSRTSYGYLKWKGIRRRSTRPHTIHTVVSSSWESAIISLRKQTGFTAAKIGYILGGLSRSTIHRVLKKKRLVNQYGNHIRPRYQETVHMHARNVHTIGYLQMDVKYITPELSGLTWTCYEYAVIDIYSRYKEAVILNQLDQDGAMMSLMTILPKLPFKPIFIQTDNGLEFQERFHTMCAELKLPHHFIHKNSPNENALIERSFRTDEEEFFFRMERAPQHYDELRKWFASYLVKYNTWRPHLGIGLKTPYKVIQLLQMS